MGNISTCFFAVLWAIFADLACIFPFLAETPGLPGLSVIGLLAEETPNVFPLDFTHNNMSGWPTTVAHDQILGGNYNCSSLFLQDQVLTMPCQAESMYKYLAPRFQAHYFPHGACFGSKLQNIWATYMEKGSFYPSDAPCSLLWSLLPLVQILYCPEKAVSVKCKLLALYLRRNLLRRHDFLVLLQRTAVHTQICMCHVSGLVVASCSTSWKPWQWIYKSLSGTLCNMFISNSEQPNSSDPYVGGGSASFSLEELQPYILAGNAPTAGFSFRFEDYVLQSELGDLKGSVACDIP